MWRLFLGMLWLASGAEECPDGECAVNLLQRAAKQVTFDDALDGEVSSSADALNGTTCRNFILTGKVQMVHYRNWVVGKAKAQGVKGWVANGGDKTYDGSHATCSTCGCVLGHVEGSAGAVSAFLRDVCRGGPPHSH
ncbi:acyP, partial [Symbiodinium sp. KB8]